MSDLTDRLKAIWVLHTDTQKTIDQAADEIDRLRRWKSTHAPRLEALEGLLKHEQLEAAKGAEAVASLDSEREANAILSDELDRLRVQCKMLQDDKAALRETQAKFGQVQHDLFMQIDALREEVARLTKIIDDAWGEA
jgi:chromosome segregation ATPase